LNLPDFFQHWSAQSPEAMAARATQILPFWVSLLLVIALGYYGARLVWLLVPGGQTVTWSPPPYVAPAVKPASDASPYAAVAQAHLFGQAAAPDDPSLANAAEAPETQLNLQLRGVVAALDERFAHAIIADSGGAEKVYFLKDAVPGGAVLHQVQADRVILSRGGVLEALLLPRLTEGGSAAYTPPRPTVTPLSRRTPGSLQEMFNQNPNSFTEIIRPQPFMPNGQLKGYRIYPGRNREQFVALGLQPGDLVTEINGMPLNNPRESMEMFRALADTNSVMVTLERNGQAQTMTLDVTQAVAAGNAPGNAANAGGPAAMPPMPAVPVVPSPLGVPMPDIDTNVEQQ
jgi:general secretion pathway protein C